MSITDVILAEGRNEESALLSPSAKARTVPMVVRPSAPVVCVPSVWELKQPVRQGPGGTVVFDEHLAYIEEQTNARRGWWMDLHTGRDLNAGTTITDSEEAVETVLQR